MLYNGTSFAVTSDNTLYGWGYNFYHQLANGATYDIGRPQSIPDLPKVKDFVFTGMTGIALCEDNCVYTWGKNYSGEAGTGNQTRVRYVTKLDAAGSDIEHLAADNSTVYAIDTGGSVYSWGSNYIRQVGNGEAATLAAPSMIPDLSKIVEVENVVRTVYSIADNGTVYGWGENDCFQSDSKSRDNALLPNMISTNQMFTAIGTGNVDSTVPIVGNIDALEISITHPANIAYTSTDIQIKNNSKVPVKVYVESFEANANGDIMFQDVLPDSIEWSALNREDTKTYIALGLRYLDDAEWISPQPESVDSIYAVNINHSYVGSLYKNAIGTLRLCGIHGLAFDGSYTTSHDIAFVVSLL